MAKKPQVKAEVTFYTHNYYNKRGDFINRVDAQVRYRDTRTGRLTKSTLGGGVYIKDLTPQIAGALQRDLQSGKKTTSQIAGILRSYGKNNASEVAKANARDNFAVALIDQYPMTDAQKNSIGYMINKLDADDFELFYKYNEYLVDRMWEAYHAHWNPEKHWHITEEEMQTVVNDVEKDLMSFLGITNKKKLYAQVRLSGFDAKAKGSIKFLGNELHDKSE